MRNYKNAKIVIAAGIFPPDIGGPATYVVKLGNALVQRGCRINIVCYTSPRENGKWKMENGKWNFSVFRVLRKGNKIVRYFKYFWKVLRVGKDCDVIYAQGPTSAGLPALFAAKLLRKKFVVKIVGDPAWEQAIGKGLTKDMIDEFQVNKYNLKIQLLKWVRSFVCRKADRVITPSEYLKGIVRGWGVDKDRVRVVYNSVENRELGIRKQELDEDVILSVGRLVKWKGFDVLIEIMPDLVRVNPKFKLIIVGDGPEKESYKLLVIRYKLEDKVELAGKLSREEVSDYLARAKMFVLNAGYEGLSHVILEAMQMGCPVITTRVGGNPEVIKDGENGLLVGYNNKEQLKSAILRLYNNDELRLGLAEQAKKDLGKFNFETMINSTEKELRN
ncbi:glycosyltransferase family 4 protein [Candidatus Falkowbacteria bacterium]|nr:glycosyltransferase family 4 protein [Candidatus Falkowbacteria bacterium]